MTLYADESWLSFTEIKEFNEKRWIKIFHHNCIKAGYFDKREDALYSIKPYLFSLIDKINDDIRINGKYEFLLEYPQMTGFNMWRQTNHPLKEDERNNPTGKTEVDGFDSMNSCSWMENGFKGLVLSSRDCTLLDGTTYQDNYYYSIGATEKWVHGSIPGNAEKDITEVLLWSRFEDIKIIRHPNRKYTNLALNVLISLFCK